jgi:hypothetical protein
MMRVVGALNVVRSTMAWLSFGDLIQILKAKARTAAIWALDGHFLGVSTAQRQILEKPSRAKSIRAFSVLTPLPELVAALNEFQPAMLNGYATAVMKETPGVYRFQAIQTAPNQLTVRLETKSPADRAEVWTPLQQQIQTYLHRQGLNNVQVELAAELPIRDPRSGKFRHVWAENMVAVTNTEDTTLLNS